MPASTTEPRHRSLFRPPQHQLVTSRADLAATSTAQPVRPGAPFLLLPRQQALTPQLRLEEDAALARTRTLVDNDLQFHQPHIVLQAPTNRSADLDTAKAGALPPFPC